MGDKITIQGCFIAFMLEAIRLNDIEMAIKLTSDEIVCFYTAETKNIIFEMFEFYINQ